MKDDDSQPTIAQQTESGPKARNTLLNQIQVNRNKELGRGRHCGRFTVRGTSPLTGATQFHRVNCKCWKCSFCGPKKAKRYKHAIRQVAATLQLRRFLTLTLDPKKIDGDPVRYLNRLFAMLRVYLRRRYGEAPQYIRILEFQKNGNPHFHILIDRFVPREWIKAAWVGIGGGYMVDIRQVDVHDVARYVSRYVTKELLLSPAPSRCRRVTTSREIKLFEKPRTECQWELLRATISLLYEIYARNVAVTVVNDEDGILASFTIAGKDPP